MKMKAEIGVMLPQAKKHLGLPEAVRSEEESFLGDLEGAWAC